jgi:hypothetical protein
MRSYLGERRRLETSISRTLQVHKLVTSGCSFVKGEDCNNPAFRNIEG